MSFYKTAGLKTNNGIWISYVTGNPLLEKDSSIFQEIVRSKLPFPALQAAGYGGLRAVDSMFLVIPKGVCLVHVPD